MVPKPSFTDSVGYAYPVQSGSHFNFTATPINGSALDGDRKNGTSRGAEGNVVHQPTPANGLRSSDHRSTSASIHGNEMSSEHGNDTAMDGRPATTSTGMPQLSSL